MHRESFPSLDLPGFIISSLNFIFFPFSPRIIYSSYAQSIDQSISSSSLFLLAYFPFLPLISLIVFSSSSQASLFLSLFSPCPELLLSSIEKNIRNKNIKSANIISDNLRKDKTGEVDVKLLGKWFIVTPLRVNKISKPCRENSPSLRTNNTAAARRRELPK